MDMVSVSVGAKGTHLQGAPICVHPTALLGRCGHPVARTPGGACHCSKPLLCGSSSSCFVDVGTCCLFIQLKGKFGSSQWEKNNLSCRVRRKEAPAWAPSLSHHPAQPSEGPQMEAHRLSQQLWASHCPLRGRPSGPASAQDLGHHPLQGCWLSVGVPLWLLLGKVTSLLGKLAFPQYSARRCLGRLQVDDP